LFGGQDRHVRRGERVDRSLERLGAMTEAGRETNDLARRMHAGVSTAGELNHDRLLGDPRQQILQYALHRSQAGLNLKAVEVGTVVLDQKFEF